ncbi:MAG TPA: hypothetical protein VFE60_27985 [Roseiarcus sp.]|jgi:hypothetical protein|nr:hypothetical protein [Roseiarcus sp.]
MPHHSGYPRHPHDFYIEDEWCFDALPAALGLADFAKGIYDPCCGVGTILQAAQRFQLQGLGSDIVDRQREVGLFKFAGLRDFLDQRTQAGCWPSVVMNPPYRETQKFIEKALSETRAGGVVAALAPLSFLVSQERYDFFQRPEMERIIFLSKRPSMPDGDALLRGDVKRGGGMEVYCWLVFRAAGRRGADVTSHWWMPPVIKKAPTERRSSRNPTPERPERLSKGPKGQRQLDLFGGDAEAKLALTRSEPSAGAEVGAAVDADGDQGASS